MKPESLREFYRQQRLTAEQVSRIRSQTAAARPARVARPVLVWGAAAAAVGIAVLCTLFLSRDWQRHEVAGQMATSHLSHGPAEFAFDTGDFEALQRRMGELDFTLAPAKDRLRERFTFSGARYCSVNGHVAAHFNVRDRRSGEEGSLYVSDLDERLASVSPSVCESRGVRVEMWTDGARFYGFAVTAAAPGNALRRSR